jgi:hypothetical protein
MADNSTTLQAQVNRTILAYRRGFEGNSFLFWAGPHFKNLVFAGIYSAGMGAAENRKAKSL